MDKNNIPQHLARMQGIQRTGDATLSADCPACHGGGALLVTLDDGGGKVKCSMGCTAEGLQNALDIPCLVTGPYEVAFFDMSLLESTPGGISPETRATVQRSLAAQCESLLYQHSILKCFTEDLQCLGYAGDMRAACVLFLAMVSRLFSTPVSVVVKGVSSAGKSFVVEMVLKFFSETAYYVLSSCSERALVFDTEPIAHRMIVIYEAVGLGGNMGNYIIRSLLSEKRISYKTTIKGEDGQFHVQTVKREGPSGLITTTTAVELHKENETRYLSVSIDDSPDQTRRVLDAIAEDKNRDVDLTRWQTLQKWIEGDACDVVIPYASALVKRIVPMAVRLRRDVMRLLALIRAHAVLHRATRERDGQGRIVATLFDYKIVYSLVAPLIAQGVEASVSREVRQTVEAVRSAIGPLQESVSVTQVARILGLDKSSASRRIIVALKARYLINEETQRGRPWKLTVGEPLPEDVEILPSPETLERECCTVARQNGHIQAPAEVVPAQPSSEAGLSADDEASDEVDWEEIEPQGTGKLARFVERECCSCGCDLFWCRQGGGEPVCSRCTPWPSWDEVVELVFAVGAEEELILEDGA